MVTICWYPGVLVSYRHVQPPPRWGDLVMVSSMPGCMCKKNEGNRLLFQHEINEINKKVSFKMGVRAAASLYMGANLLGILYTIMHKSAGTELQFI